MLVALFLVFDVTTVQAKSKVKTLTMLEEPEKSELLKVGKAYKTKLKVNKINLYAKIEVTVDGEYMLELTNLKSKSGYGLLHSEIRTEGGNRVLYCSPMMEHGYLSTLYREYKEGCVTSAQISAVRGCVDSIKEKVNLKKDRLYYLILKGDTLERKEWKNCTLQIKLKSS